MKEQIRTKRLTLVPLTDGELEALMNRETDPHMKGAYGEMLSGCRDHPADRLFYTEWRMTLPDGTSIGGLGFKGPAVNGAVDLGYGVDPAYRGNGYATEAAAGMIRWAFARQDVYVVEAEAEPNNAASLSVLRKLGFTEIGTGREGLRFEKEKPASALTTVYMSVGMCLGTAVGAALDKLSLALPIGLCLGLCLGNVLDGRENEKRATLMAAREKQRNSAAR